MIQLKIMDVPYRRQRAITIEADGAIHVIGYISVSGEAVLRRYCHDLAMAIYTKEKGERG